MKPETAKPKPMPDIEVDVDRAHRLATIVLTNPEPNTKPRQR